MKQNNGLNRNWNNAQKRRIRKYKQVNDIDHTLLYLRESLANYTENKMGQQLYEKVEAKHYANEAAFVKDLNDKEMAYLDSILKREIDYAKNAQDNTRLSQLNEVHELIF